MSEKVCRTCGFSHPETDCPRWPQRQENEFTSQTDAELEIRFADLYLQIMAGHDSLPLATWTAEYRAARRDIQTREVQFRAIGTELARRLTERTAHWRETMDAALKGIIDGTSEPGGHAHDWHCMGCGADYDGDTDLHICLPGGPNSE